MKTYYDGEEREILSIKFLYVHPKWGDIWLVKYRRDVVEAEIHVPAKDELDAYNKFPAELELLSINNEE